MGRVAACLLVLLFVSGCGVSSENPLSEPDYSIVDDRLTGVWVSAPEESDSNETVYVHFLRDSTGPMVAVVIVQEEKGARRGHFMTFAVTLSKVDDRDFMNLRQLSLSVPGDPEGIQELHSASPFAENYLLVRYEFTDSDNVQLWIMSQEIVVDDVRAGHLAGEVNEESIIGPTARITADSETLADYVRERDPETAFGTSWVKFRRLD